MKRMMIAFLLLAFPTSAPAAGSTLDGEVCAGYRAMNDEDALATVAAEMKSWAALTAETRELENDGRLGDDPALAEKAREAGTAMGRVYLLCSCNDRLEKSEPCISIRAEIEALIYP